MTTADECSCSRDVSAAACWWLTTSAAAVFAAAADRYELTVRNDSILYCRSFLLDKRCCLLWALNA